MIIISGNRAGQSVQNAEAFKLVFLILGHFGPYSTALLHLLIVLTICLCISSNNLKLEDLLKLVYSQVAY